MQFYVRMFRGVIRAFLFAVLGACDEGQSRRDRSCRWTEGPFRRSRPEGRDGAILALEDTGTAAGLGARSVSVE